jgi:hypothetical protein
LPGKRPSVARWCAACSVMAPRLRRVLAVGRTRVRYSIAAQSAYEVTRTLRNPASGGRGRLGTDESRDVGLKSRAAAADGERDCPKANTERSTCRYIQHRCFRSTQEALSPAETGKDIQCALNRSTRSSGTRSAIPWW